MKKQNPIALLPIAVFLVLYLGLGILFEYVMKIPMGFYNVPIIIAFLVAILVACLQNRSVKFDQKLEIMAQGLADKNIITMLLIFLTAGAFVGVVGRSSAESVAYFMLSLIPARFAVMVLFVVACFVSIAMGTSVGTITLIVPIAAAVSDASGFGLPLCIGSVMGGAMFGDNLSFISDTTIAACNGQGCQMKDKFRENFYCTSGGSNDSGCYSNSVIQDRYRGRCIAGISSVADSTVYSRADRWNCRNKCICSAYNRNHIGNGHNACNRKYSTIRSAYQYGKWSVRHV